MLEGMLAEPDNSDMIIERGDKDYEEKSVDGSKD
jgi:hypothetical protein